MSGHWPPDWDADSPADEFSGEYSYTGDIDTGDIDTGDIDQATPDPELAARLAEVAAFLASVPDPVLPPVIEARISAAIAAEAQSPDTRSEVADLSAFARRSRWRKLRSGKVLAPVAACLVLGLAGYLASVANDSSGQMSPLNAAAGSAAAGTAGSTQSPAVFGQQATAGDNRQAALPAAAGPTAAAFVVTQSGTKYAAATLAEQAQAVAATYASSTSSRAALTPKAPATYAYASAAAPEPAAGYSPPSGQLLGCVEHFTGAAQPRLVDRGTYRGTPAYVIVGESKVWVVGLGCTASHPELLASAAITG